MIKILQQFYKALVATMAMCRQKADAQDVEVEALTVQLQAKTVEMDALAAEQQEAIKLIHEMTKELDKQ